MSLFRQDSVIASKVSVIIPCFNAAAWIRDTLASVLAQSITDLEIIAVDDGSTDGTGEIIQREFGAVHVVRTSNCGPSSARNLGTSLASGEFIQYLDADDLLGSGKIRRQRDLLGSSGADVAYGDWHWLVPDKAGFVQGPIVSRTLSEPELELFDSQFWSPTGAYLFRRRIVDRIGGWNETLPLTEDERFLLDCAVQGGRFIHTPGIMAYYRKVAHSTGQRDWVMNRRCRYRNAVDIEAFWGARGPLSDAQRGVMERCLGRLARACVDTDRATYGEVLARLERTFPEYIPLRPASLRIIAKMVGYRRAEEVARCYRHVKRRCGLTRFRA